MTEFEEIKKNDINNLVELAKEIWQEYSICFITPEQINYMLDKFQSKHAIQKQIQNGYKYYFIKDNNKIAGYFGFQIQETNLFLSKIYIKKEYRNKGLGRKSFEFLKLEAKEKNCNKITLTVNKTNTQSIKTYYAWGLTKTADIKTDIGNNYFMDDYILEYKI